MLVLMAPMTYEAPAAGLGAACVPLTLEQIYRLARQAGFPPDVATTMTAVAMRESRGCPDAYNPGVPVGKEDSYGLWQINIKGNPGILKALGLTSPQQLFDPATNAAAAARLWNGDNRNLDIAWYVNRPGYKEDYERFMPAAQLAASNVDGGGSDLPGWPPKLPGEKDTVTLAGMEMPLAAAFLGAVLVFGAVWVASR